MEYVHETVKHAGKLLFFISLGISARAASTSIRDNLTSIS